MSKKNVPVIVLAIALVAAIVVAIVGFVQRGDLSDQVTALNTELTAAKTAADEAAAAAADELAAAKTAADEAAAAAADELAAAKTAAEEAAAAAATELAAVKTAAEEAAKTAADEAAAAAEALDAAAAQIAELKAAAAETAKTAAVTKAAAKADLAIAAAGQLKGDIVILFTSDVHCGIDQGFGYVGLAEIKSALSEKYEVILVDDGDSVQGEPVGTMTKGDAVVSMMNAVGYDVVTIGNHEFDYGMENFLSLTEKAEFPYVSANFTYMDELVFKPYTIIEKAGKKIAFIGVTTPRTFVTSTPTYFQNENGEYVYGFMEDESGEKLYAAVQAAIDAARAEGADYVIALAHLGNEEDSQPWQSNAVIANTTGLDALLDGHAHETMPKDLCMNKDGKFIVRAACGTKLANVGYLTISENGKISTGLFECPADTVVDEYVAGIDAALDAATAELNAKLAEVVANTAVDLVINDPNVTDENGKAVRIIRSRETNLGDLVADAYRDQAGAQIALVNGGGIRATIPAGDITMAQVLSVHPFGNELTMVEATGQQIVDALEWTARNTPSENGGFLHVSGLTYEIHTYIETSCTNDDKGNFTGVTGERRVQNVMVDGEPIDLEKTYTVASHNYMLLSGGDGTNMFMDDNVLLNGVKLDNQVLIDYIIDTLQGVVGEEYADPYGQGRIVIVTEAAAEAPAA